MENGVEWLIMTALALLNYGNNIHYFPNYPYLSLKMDIEPIICPICKELIEKSPCIWTPYKIKNNELLWGYPIHIKCKTMVMNE